MAPLFFLPSQTSDTFLLLLLLQFSTPQQSNILVFTTTPPSLLCKPPYQLSPLQPFACLRRTRVSTMQPCFASGTEVDSQKKWRNLCRQAGTVPRLKVVFSYAGSPTHSQKVISEVSWGIYLGNMPLNTLGPKAPTDHLLQEVARDGPVVPCGWQ